jgi:hypothetical protein
MQGMGGGQGGAPDPNDFRSEQAGAGAGAGGGGGMGDMAEMMKGMGGGEGGAGTVVPTVNKTKKNKKQRIFVFLFFVPSVHFYFNLHSMTLWPFLCVTTTVNLRWHGHGEDDGDDEGHEGPHNFKILLFATFLPTLLYF